MYQPEHDSSADWVVFLVLTISLVVNVWLTLQLRQRLQVISLYEKQLSDSQALTASEMNELSARDAPSRGQSTAPVTMVVFTDFQCPFCRKLANTLRQVEGKPELRVRVRTVVREMPLTIHPYARKEAELGACVAQQNVSAFWAVHDFFFQGADGKKDLTNDALAFADSRSDINATRLHDCMMERQSTAQVDRDIELAKKYRVQSTPTIFVNGTRIIGEVTPEYLAQVIGEKSIH